MGQCQSGAKAQPVRVARVYKGECGICFKPIWPGEAYELRGGSIIRNNCLVHFNCFKPDGAPTWEERIRRE